MKPRLLIAGGTLLVFSFARAADNELNVDVAGQAIQGDTASSKFEEYTDVPRGAYVDSLDARTNGATYYFELRADKPGLKDQRVEVEGGQWGLHKIALTYDQIPHNLSNTAQTYLHDQGNGVFTLPNSMQSSLQTSSTNAAGFFSDTPFVPLRIDRKRGDLSYSYNPQGLWRMNFGYTGEKKEGNKAIGVTYGHSQIEEALEPVKYQTHDIHIGTEYASKDLGFSTDYRFSTFLDEIKALTVDNPFRLTNATLSSSGASAPGTARLALPPSNQNHQASLAFTTKLPAKSRLSVNGQYSIQTQNDNFLPLTSNQAILNDPRLPALPDTNLHGRIDTWNADAKWNWKPVEQTNVNFHGRHYRVDNKTPSLLFQQYVPYDASFATSTPTTTFNPSRSRQSLPNGYNKTDAGADVLYYLAKPVSLKLAYNWEQYLRDFRESFKTTENTYTASLNFKPHPRFVIRPSYQYAYRRVADYDAERVAEEAFPLGEGTSLGQLPGLRKYDQASRERNKMSARADWDIFDALNIGLDTGYTRDDFMTDYGLLDQENLYYSADLGFSPSESVNLYGGYTWERVTENTRSRYRATGLDTAANDWRGQLDDLSQTVNAGLTCWLIKDKLETDLSWTMTYSRGSQQANNPNTLTGTASQITSATATDLPNTYNRLHVARATFRYKWSERVGVRLQYEYERYTETDWSQDTLDVYQTVWNRSVFLGASQPSYTAHLFALALSYRFL